MATTNGHWRRRSPSTLRWRLSLLHPGQGITEIDWTEEKPIHDAMPLMRDGLPVRVPEEHESIPRDIYALVLKMGESLVFGNRRKQLKLLVHLIKAKVSGRILSAEHIVRDFEDYKRDDTPWSAHKGRVLLRQLKASLQKYENSPDAEADEYAITMPKGYKLLIAARGNGPKEPLNKVRSDHREVLLQHWIPRAMGSESIFHGERWYFTGRVKVLRKIISWLDQRESTGSILAITGNPGSGKSAVLGYVVTASDSLETSQPAFQEFLASMPFGTRPAIGGLHFAFHLRKKTLADTTAALAERFSCTPENLLAKLTESTSKTVLLFDALDEADNPQEIASELLRAISKYANLWILVGTRRPELKLLGPSVTALDLDSSAYSCDEDVATYVEKLLLADKENRISPYRGDVDTARKVAIAVANASKGNFLLARINAKWLIEHQTTMEVNRTQIPDTLEEAFGAYLRGVAERTGMSERRLRRYLSPLAYAKGQGMPVEVWARLVGRQSEFIERLSSEVAAFVSEYQGIDQPLFRLYHAKLAELLRDPMREREHERRIARILMKAAEYPNLLSADWYTRKYLLQHLAAGGIADEVPPYILFTAYWMDSLIPGFEELATQTRERLKDGRTVKSSNKPGTINL